MRSMVEGLCTGASTIRLSPNGPPPRGKLGEEQVTRPTGPLRPPVL